jgi:hypothetical protein
MKTHGEHILALLLIAGWPISSCTDTFPLAGAPTPSLSASGNTGNLDEHTVVFEGTSFTYPSSLAEGAVASKIPAFVNPLGFMYDDLPEHVRFDFTAPYTTHKQFVVLQSGWAPWLKHNYAESREIRPQIFIFPTRSYADISPLAGERIQALKTLLHTHELSAGGQLPILPTFNSGQDFYGQVRPLEFQGGRGLRFITRYSQEATPIVNPDVFYTFQGLTEDGSLYVAAFFPLYISSLPDLTHVEDWEEFSQAYPEYVVDIASRLERCNPDDFEPDLESLDALIKSLNISHSGYEIGEN